MSGDFSCTIQYRHSEQFRWTLPRVSLPHSSRNRDCGILVHSISLHLASAGPPPNPGVKKSSGHGVRSLGFATGASGMGPSPLEPCPTDVVTSGCCTLRFGYRSLSSVQCLGRCRVRGNRGHGSVTVQYNSFRGVHIQCWPGRGKPCPLDFFTPGFGGFAVLALSGRPPLPAEWRCHAPAVADPPGSTII